MSTNGPTPGMNPHGQQPFPPPPPQQVPSTPPPGTYAQPGVPPQPQQAYGYQQPAPGQGHQFPGAPGPVPPAQPRKKSKAGLVVVLVVALLLLGGAGGAAWFLLGNSSAEPYWSVPTDAEALSTVDEVDGTWFTDKAVVQTWAGGVKAFNKQTGKRLWAKPLPGSGNVPCIAPAQSSGDIGVVAYGASTTDGLTESCDGVVAYDLNSGEELWHKEFKAKADAPGDLNLSVARAGEVVVVQTSKELRALKVSDGSVAWDAGKPLNKDCEKVSYTGGQNLIWIRSCYAGDAFKDTERWWKDVALIDPATGESKWMEKFPSEQAEKMSVYSTSPLVIQNGSKGLVSVDENTGRTLAKFEGGEAISSYGTWAKSGSPLRTVTSVGNIFVMSGSDPGDYEGGRQSMIAFDLNTGKQLWKTKPEKVINLFPLHTGSKDRILAYEDRASDPPRLVEFSAKDGAKKTVLEYADGVQESLSATAQPFWNADRVYVSSIEGSLSTSADSYALVALPGKKQ
ncbi:PQQ-binding-like beta-propeller repeat protein [Streptomyces sp. B-S-A8]|uniref:PQQ-binding-like beta-propeller repeat protein n=1 Tax=Streptomyces solicavernae TaxID=3043614 RepID=A0ABT6RV45_9ACTN|nr:PQQ-binding-like beta-propeller repeat protein [Streptomyces sp. B-S-A8]MDI3388307.1 PQQ-binding-like beta-propeller repeat protein [Streptomyces sp. B-S-A8]